VPCAGIIWLSVTNALIGELVPDLDIEQMALLRSLLDGPALSRHLRHVGLSTHGVAQRLNGLERQGYVYRLPFGPNGHAQAVPRGSSLWSLTEAGQRRLSMHTSDPPNCRVPSAVEGAWR
jgi:hypothetical protein